MKFATIVSCVFICSGCAEPPKQSNAQVGPIPEVISLSPIPGLDLHLSQEVTHQQAQAIATAYLHFYSNGCGMAETVLQNGDYWNAHILVGYGGSDGGVFWIAKDGSKVLFRPTQKGWANYRSVAKFRSRSEAIK